MTRNPPDPDPATRTRQLRDDDRGTSVAVNHVLAIGITAILISGLLLTAASILDDRQRSAARNELKTIGNRLADQIAEADRTVDSDSQPEQVEYTITQPDRVAGNTYAVVLLERPCEDSDAQQPSNSDATNFCLRLTHDAVRNERIEVPVEVDGDVTGSEVVLEFEQEANGEFRIEMCNPPSSFPGCP